MIRRKIATARRRLGTIAYLSRVDPALIEGMFAAGRAVTEEHIDAITSPTISSTALIHPLASLRFTDRVEIGDKASIGPFCCIWGGWSRTWARVGDRALLAPGVVLVAGNHITSGHGPIRDQGFEELDVVIGPGSWIGAHAVVIGCTVGEGAVVGAGAVVTKDVPPFAIAVGTPAKVVGWRNPEDELPA